MKIKSMEIVSLAAAVLAAANVITGCGTTSGYQQADKVGAGAAEFREEIVNGQNAINGTMIALNQVAATANTNPREAFKQYSKSLANLESAAERTRKVAADMKAQGQAYFENWEKQMADVKNPEIKNLAQQQKAKLQAAFDNIKKYTEPLKAQFDPWLSDLKDLQTYLSNDLTVTGVDAAKSLFTKTQTEGAAVQQSMNALIVELNSLAAALTPANVKPK